MTYAASKPPDRSEFPNRATVMLAAALGLLARKSPAAFARRGADAGTRQGSSLLAGLVRATRRTARLGERTDILLLFVMAALGGCSTIPEAPKEVRVPVAVPCIERPPVKPSMLSDAELLALDDFGLVIALARDRRIRQGWEATLEALLEGCR